MPIPHKQFFDTCLGLPYIPNNVRWPELQQTAEIEIKQRLDAIDAKLDRLLGINSSGVLLPTKDEIRCFGAKTRRNS